MITKLCPQISYASTYKFLLI